MYSMKIKIETKQKIHYILHIFSKDISYYYYAELLLLLLLLFYFFQFSYIGNNVRVGKVYIQRG